MKLFNVNQLSNAYLAETRWEKIKKEFKNNTVKDHRKSMIR